MKQIRLGKTDIEKNSSEILSINKNIDEVKNMNEEQLKPKKGEFTAKKKKLIRDHTLLLGNFEGRRSRSQFLFLKKKEHRYAHNG